MNHGFVGTQMMNGRAAVARLLTMGAGAKVPGPRAYRLLAAGVRAANCGGEGKIA